jgi:hypothetical protein
MIEIEAQNVIDLKSRKPYRLVREEQIKARRKAKRQAKKELDEGRAEYREAILSSLRQITKLVEEGKLHGLILLAQEPKSKLFLTDVVLDERFVPAQDLFAFVGCLEALKLELSDASTMAPVLGLDGSVIDPEVNYIEDYEE